MNHKVSKPRNRELDESQSFKIETMERSKRVGKFANAMNV